MKIHARPKQLVAPMKRFNACQKRAVRGIELGNILHLQVEDIPKRMCRRFLRCFHQSNMCLRLENGLVVLVREEDVHTPNFTHSHFTQIYAHACHHYHTHLRKS
nr:uncharacterized protein LOC109168150 [Ipomoea batatas]